MIGLSKPSIRSVAAGVGGIVAGWYAQLPSVPNDLTVAVAID